MSNVINWPSGLGPTYNKIKQNQEIIRTGVVLAIDPSSGSANSQPGFALYENSKLLLNGTIKIDHKQTIYNRLPELYFKIQELVACPPDVLVIETINKQSGHVFLLWAVGVSIAATRAPVVVELHNAIWRSVAKSIPTYKKSDAADAELMARAVILLAQREHNKHVDIESLPIGTDT